MSRVALFLALGLAGAPLQAELRPIGHAVVQVFEAKAKVFKPQRVEVLYQPTPERLQLHLPSVAPGQALYARVELQSLPHYQDWVNRRREEGGLAWSALERLLRDLQGRPAVILTLGPLPSQGPVELRVGLLDGSRFELYGRVRGTLSQGRQGLFFEAERLLLEKASAQAAWTVLAPLARSQASRMAGQR